MVTNFYVFINLNEKLVYNISYSMVDIRNKWLYNFNTLFHVDFSKAMKINSIERIWNVTGELKLNRW